MTQGIIFNIQRYSTEDGPGIRTTVFCKGCPLRCQWCHNPEGLKKTLEVIWLGVRCIGCGQCVEECPNQAISRQPEGLVVDRERCALCGHCQDICPAGARELTGRTVTVEELVEEVERDRLFYETSSGGVTISGGEPTFQPEFTGAFLGACAERGLHTALDTCGFCAWEVLKGLAASAKMVLFDLKAAEQDRHKELTGVSNELILDNLRRLAEAGVRLWIRIPLIPGRTDDRDNLAGLGRILASLPPVERIDLLPYHGMAEDQYRRLDRPYTLVGTAPPGPEELARAREILRREGVRADIRF